MELGLGTRRGHSEACRARIEAAIGESSSGKDRLQRVKDRLDIRTAHAGMEFIEDDKEVAPDAQPEVAMDAAEDAPELVDAPLESREVAIHPTDDGGLAETPVELEDGIQRTSDRRFNTPERKSAVKRKGADDDMQDAKFQCTQDSPDGSMDSGDGIDIDSIGKALDDKKAEDKIDSKIIASFLFGVDITEVYSPERVNKVVKKWGLVPGSSLDLTNGFDFTKAEDRKRAWTRVKEEDPFLLVGSPPCTLFSLLQELNLVVNKNKPGWMDEFNRRKAEAIEHIRFCCLLYEYQLRRGKHFLHEHPWSARSWELDCIKHVMSFPNVQLVEGHMCQFGMTTHVNEKHGEQGLVKKPTGFLTSSECVARLLNRTCQGGHAHVPLVGGRAAGAQVYPDKLCEAIVKGMLRQKELDESSRISTTTMDRGMLDSFTKSICVDMRRERAGIWGGNCSSITRSDGINKPVGDWPDDWVDAVHEDDGGEDSIGVRPQSGAHILREAMYGLVCRNTMWKAWDDVTGADLNVEDVKAARKLEMEYFKKLGVYEVVSRDMVQLTGGKLIGTRWVDVNKGDSTNVECRSRLVGREFNVGRDDALYAATPPLEALRLIVSDAATIAGGDGTKRLMVNDVRRAYFYAKIDRDVFIELPAEDPEYGTGKVGKLKLCLYGTRDAAKGWQETLSAHLEGLGFTRGVGHPSVFHHASRGLKTLVHGDDYVTSGRPLDLRWLEEELSKAYEIKTQHLGLDKGSLSEGKVLNRIIRATQSGWEIEADPRHAELVVEQLGLQHEKSVATPGVGGQDEDDLEDDVPLTGDDVTAYRGVAARYNYLGPDRTDCNYAIKECCREMSTPTTGSLRRLKRMGRYLKKYPRLVWLFDFQGPVTVIDLYTDADWAGCRRSRKSTSGGVAMLGGHCIKSWAKTQSVIAKSSAESELYSVVKGATEGLGLITLCSDLGSNMEARLNLDATAAKGILERQGISKVRHIDVNVLWMQQQMAKKLIPLVKVDGSLNCADLLTKHLVANVQQRHVAMMQLEFRDGRAQMAAQLHSITQLQPQGEFTEGGTADRWSTKGEQGIWVRQHRAPRTTLFTPRGSAHGPGRKTRLSAIRETIGVDETGRKFSMKDRWMESRQPPSLPRRWTGITIFKTVGFDDLDHGGDQRRQRDRVGDAPSSSSTPRRSRVSWADAEDSS